MILDWMITYQGEDITEKVGNWSIRASLEMYAREITMEVYDNELFLGFDFSELPETADLEVFTEVNDGGMVSQGKFFVEKPTFRASIDRDTVGIWGRSSTAVLGEPFGPKISKLWDANIRFYALCAELCALVGLTFDSTFCDLPDFTILANTFEATEAYPIDVLKQLVELVVGAEGYITTDPAGNVRIVQLDRSPSSAVEHNLTDAITQEFIEEPEWPEFANRICIMPADTLSQYNVDLVLAGESKCITALVAGMPFINDTLSFYCRVTDNENRPVNRVTVDWEMTPTVPDVMFQLPTPGYIASTQTRTIVITQSVRAYSKTVVDLDFEPDADGIIGIWAFRDLTRTTNFIQNNNYTIDGKRIILNAGSFTYCDQYLTVAYRVSGMAVNHIKAGVGSTVVGADLVIQASVQGRTSEETIYLNNDCQCPITLNIEVDESHLLKPYGGSWPVATITAYVEAEGIGVSTIIDWSLLFNPLDDFGATISPGSGTTGSSDITGEVCDVLNAISGISQVRTSHPIITSAVDVRKCLGGTKTGDNLYASHTGNIITLTEVIDDSYQVSVDYVTNGVAVTVMTPTGSPSAPVQVAVKGVVPSSREAGLSDTVYIDCEMAVATQEAAVNAGSKISGPTTGLYTDSKYQYTTTLEDPDWFIEEYGYIHQMNWAHFEGPTRGCVGTIVSPISGNPMNVCVYGSSVTFDTGAGSMPPEQVSSKFKIGARSRTTGEISYLEVTVSRTYYSVVFRSSGTIFNNFQPGYYAGNTVGGTICPVIIGTGNVDYEHFYRSCVKIRRGESGPLVYPEGSMGGLYP